MVWKPTIPAARTTRQWSAYGEALEDLRRGEGDIEEGADGSVGEFKISTVQGGMR